LEAVWLLSRMEALWANHLVCVELDSISVSHSSEMKEVDKLRSTETTILELERG
jgi:hypothetical protein